MTAETMMKEYRSLKRELSVTGFQLQRFEGISENEMIESMLYSHHEGERVQTSTLSDKTAGIAVNYRKIMERENDGWYQYLFNRYLYLLEEIDFFERSVSALSGQLPGVVMDLVEGELTWENIAAKYHVSTAMIAKYKKKAAAELEKMYGFRDKQVEAYVLG